MAQKIKTPKDIVGLYKNVPEYSELKNLGSWEFINRIEILKEEFRGIRSSLLDDSDETECSLEQVNKITQCSASSKRKEELLKQNLFRTNLTSGKTSTSYLSIRKCEMNPNPIMSPVRLYRRLVTKPSGPLFYSQPTLHMCQDRWSLSSISTISDSLSSSTSTPEISMVRRTEYIPPQNIENRLQKRQAQKQAIVDATPPNTDTMRVKPVEVPPSVTNPMLDNISKQNSKRSLRVREESKDKLLAKVKPFSFSTTMSKRLKDTSMDVLNNTKQVKGKNAADLKIHNNRLDTSKFFKAHPAPPRSRALMAALRLKEQQEYRELKKHLRAEALLKLSSLPPRMASRNRYRATPNSSLAPMKLQSTQSQLFNREESSSSDDDRASEDSPSHKNVSNNGKPVRRKPFHGSIWSGNNTARASGLGVFESTSNDNNASRLRIEAVKRKEQERQSRDEREKLKQYREDEKKNKLRSYHYDAWRHVTSYTSSRDIDMRRELRMAAAILETDSFRKNMSTMLNRVQSAPLLLEGIRERRAQPCKQHQHAFASGYLNTTVEKNIAARNNWQSPRPCGGHRYSSPRDGQSDTLALAEGSISSSDNESSVGEIDIEEKNKTENDKVAIEKERFGEIDALEAEREADAILTASIGDTQGEDDVREDP